MENICDHLKNMKDQSPNPKSEGCAQCVAQGDSWVHLRLCLSCGNVGCCDSSKNKHASQHFRQTNHPVIRSFQPGENWQWCFMDQIVFDPSQEESRTISKESA